MAWVKYPFHVKHDGTDYRPGEPIEVSDAAEHLLRGAAIAEAPVQPEKPVKKRRAAKAAE